LIEKRLTNIARVRILLTLYPFKQLNVEKPAIFFLRNQFSAKISFCPDHQGRHGRDRKHLDPFLPYTLNRSDLNADWNERPYLRPEKSRLYPKRLPEKTVKPFSC